MQSERTIQSALGWFDLGNYVEAFNELDYLPPEHRASVEVVELRCRIYRKLEKWRDLEMVAEGCLASVKDSTNRPGALIKPTEAFRVWIPMEKLTNALVVQ